MLISASYLQQQQTMHENPRYGAASRKFAPRVVEVIARFRPLSILDYGAGKCALRDALGDALTVPLVEYDPAIPGIDQLPDETFDLVCCLDVLEHIESACLEDVLATIRSRTRRVAFLTIHTGPAGKFLPDGRNAHLIQQPAGWWKRKLREHFGRVVSERASQTTFFMTCEVGRA